MIACHRLDDALDETLRSVHAALQLLPPASGQECLLVLDGISLKDARDALSGLPRASRWLNLRPVASRGLTRCLIEGCAEARGDAIARIDVGDVMAPERLQRQVEAFQQHPELVLATSHVEVCGPHWEPLWINCGSDQHPGQLQRVDTCLPEQGIAMDIPHHASVMFRRSAYEAVGGYRPEFYFGQDWDLWYRLAGQGTFVHIPEVLTKVRLFPSGLSSRHWREQRAIAQLSLACHGARSRGESEQPLLQQAAAIRPRPPATRKPLFDGARAEGAYFIAEALRRNGDRRCWAYFREALRNGFWKPRVWLRAVQSSAIARV